MPKRYAISIVEKNSDLIRILNNGEPVPMRIDGVLTYFLFDAVPPTTVENRDIKIEDDLYDKDERIKDDVIILL